MVNEEESEPDPADRLVQAEGEEEEEDDNDATLLNPHPIQSPGGMSQMSGTTAVTSFTAPTTHSEAAIADMDAEVAELLPELYQNSGRIVDLLAPANIDKKRLAAILKDLKIPGSRTAARLGRNEEVFNDLRPSFGKDRYIQPDIVLRKLLGNDFGIGDFRPDAILHAGNLAIFVKGFLVQQKESSGMQSLLAISDTFFPEVFVAGFGTTNRYGNSRLLDDSFNMALALRTQYTILELAQFKEHENWNPEQIVANIFYDPSPERLGDRDNLKKLMRGGPANSEKQIDMIIDRIKVIQSTFRQNEDAHEQGDLVDLERLEEYFPWTDFLIGLADWSHSRLKEIRQSVSEQGGEDNIKALLDEMMGVNASQNQTSAQAKTPILGPPAKIISRSTGARLLAELKRKRNSDTSTVSSKSKPPTTSGRNTVNAQAGPSTAPASHRIEEQEFEDFQPDVGNDDAPPSESDDILPQGTARESIKHWNSSVNEKNKENLPVDEAVRPVKRLRMTDPQPGAHKVTWDDGTQEDIQDRRNPKQLSRGRQQTQESEESEDEGFQEDLRAPNPRKRLHVPARRESSEEIEPPAGSHRRQQSSEPQASRQRDENRAARRRQEQEEARLQASARVGEEEDDDEIVAAPPSTAAIASKIARERTALAKAARPAASRGRSYWSNSDEDELIRLIEEHGCAWSVIERHANFEDDRNQVQLKDKARNLKVNFIK